MDVYSSRTSTVLAPHRFASCDVVFLRFPLPRAENLTTFSWESRHGAYDIALLLLSDNQVDRSQNDRRA